MAQLNVFNRKVFIKDVSVVLIIVALPFLFFLYTLVPETQIWETRVITIRSIFFEDVNFSIWIFLGKLMTILFLCIWFITCRHHWRYFIFFPIIVEFYRFHGYFVEDFIGYQFKSRIISFIESLPFSLILILILLLISIKLRYYNSKIRDANKLDDKIYEQISKFTIGDINSIKSLSKQLYNLKLKRSEYSSKDFLVELYKIRLALLKYKDQ